MSVREDSDTRNGNRWMVISVIVFVISAFTGGYGFFTSNFVSRREFDEVKLEQNRRAPMVHGIPNELIEIRRRLTDIESMLRRGR